MNKTIFFLYEYCPNKRNEDAGGQSSYLVAVGRVSQDAQHMLETNGGYKMTEEQYLSDTSITTLSYSVADVVLWFHQGGEEDLYARIEKTSFDNYNRLLNISL